ncbi:MAG: NAD(+)/NADH kinase [Pseudobdellovibrionaceae bacterium]
MKINKFKLKNPKNIFIYYRSQTPKATECSEKLAVWLQKKKFKVYSTAEPQWIPGTLPVKTQNMLDKIDLVVVLGGDGTYLRAVQILAGRQIPILGFNMGSLGFLTAHNASEMFDLVEAALSGGMIQKPRSMIDAKIVRKNKTRGQFHALNDVVIERGDLSQLINTIIHSENFFVSKVKADGFIISSPSGSTAYNLAAGGPIVHPDTKALVVTAVAPHSLTSRPLIFPDHLELRFKLDAPTQSAYLIVDGQKKITLSLDDEVVIKRSRFDHWVVRAPNHNFFHLLREKLRFGDR